MVMLDTVIHMGMQELTLLLILPTHHMLGTLDMDMLPPLLPLLMLLPTKLSKFNPVKSPRTFQLPKSNLPVLLSNVRRTKSVMYFVALMYSFCLFKFFEIK